jgi:hypothetical protein
MVLQVAMGGPAKVTMLGSGLQPVLFTNPNLSRERADFPLEVSL